MEHQRYLANHRVQLGQVFRAVNDVRVGVSVLYKAPGSSGHEGILLKDTRVVIENSPPSGATHVYALPLNYAELEKSLVPDKERTHPQYQGYGISIHLEYLKRHFVRENDAAVTFDDARASAHWQLVLKYSAR